MRIRIGPASVACLLPVAGCDAPTPPAPPAPTNHLGSYQLTTVIGEPLPVVVAHQLNYGYRRVITTGQLSLTDSGVYAIQVGWRDEDEQSGQVIAQGTDSARGHFARIADSVRFMGESTFSTQPVEPLSSGPMVVDGWLQLPELRALLFTFVATFQKQ